MTLALLMRIGRGLPLRLVPWRLLALLALSVLSAAAGCSRAYYRLQADREVYDLIAEKANDPRWPLEGYTIELDPRSRLYDPTSPDFPPMPADDPASHRLMHRIDGKQHYPCWHRNGDLDSVDSMQWLESLPFDDRGVLTIDQDLAVELALTHSRDFQQQLETLYLSALDVSFERFRFDTQFFGGQSKTFTADGARRGPRSQSTFDVTTDAQLRRLFATGGELVVGFANSFVWQFAGPNTETVNSLLDFSLVQPLLRAGGRARVLETLTISERVLLANIRQMERFRRGFYLQVIIGRNAGQGPQRRGGFFGGSGFGGFAGVGGGGFGRVGGGGGFGAGGGTGAAQAGGFVGLLQDQKQIQFQEANVVGLRDALAQLEAAYDAGRIDLFQVNQNRTALFNSQSQLLSLKTAYQNSLDRFKIDLGLPPELNVEIRDPLLDRFDLIDPRLTKIQSDLVDLLNALRNPPDGADRQSPATLLDHARSIRQATIRHFRVVRQDHQRLLANAPERRKNLARLAQREEVRRGDVDPDLYDVDQFNQRVAAISRDLVALADRLEATLDAWNQTLERLEPQVLNRAQLDPEQRQALIDLGLDLSNELAELLLVQARTRLDAIKVYPVDLSSEQAWEIAAANRRDLMNARATLVDQWRLIEFNANDLLSDLDFTFSGDIGTLGDNPVRFRDTTGRLRVGLEFDAPLTRLAERNTYRISLIEYQQARRQFMAFEDTISSGLRETLRTIELNQLNLEIRRASVLVAIAQVEQAQLRLREPPKPGQPGQTSQLGATTARDLVDALRGLASAQSDFLSVWVNYDIQRAGLDFDLGTMQLDQRGVWIDPGPISAERFGPVYGPPLPPELDCPTASQSPSSENAEGKNREILSPAETTIAPAGFNLSDGVDPPARGVLRAAGALPDDRDSGPRSTAPYRDSSDHANRTLPQDHAPAWKRRETPKETNRSEENHQATASDPALRFDPFDPRPVDAGAVAQPAEPPAGRPPRRGRPPVALSQSSSPTQSVQPAVFESETPASR